VTTQKVAPSPAVATVAEEDPKSIEPRAAGTKKRDFCGGQPSVAPQDAGDVTVPTSGWDAASLDDEVFASAETSASGLLQESTGAIQAVALFDNEAVPPKPVPDPGASAIPHGEMTLAALQQMALQNNPTLSLAGAEIEKERGLWQQVGLYPNPTVGYVNSSTSSNGQSQQNGMLVQQTFITAGKLEKARATEAFGVQDAQWQQEAQRIRVLNDVKLRYYDVLAAQQQIEIAKELSALSEQALDAAHALLKGMQVPKTDVLRAEVQHQRIQTALQNSQLEYQAAWHKLAVIIGCPQMAPMPLQQPAEDLPTFDLEQEWQRLLAESPQLKQMQAEVGIAQTQWVSAEAAPIPDITVQFVGNYDSIGDYGTFNSLVALPLPIFNRNQGGIYNASQEYVRSQKEVERVCLVLRDQLVTSHGNYVIAKNQAERLRTEVLPKLKENLELTVKGYRVQEYSILEVLSAQDAALQSNLEYVASLTEARRLAVEVEGLQLTGGLNPASIGTAIQEVGTGGRLRAVKAQLEKQNNAGLSNFVPSALR
jgi:cobalt-zinc-cadmium efflux system outer membrane protein